MKNINFKSVLISSNIVLLLLCILLIFSNIKLKKDTLILVLKKENRLSMVYDSIYANCEKTRPLFKSRGLLPIIIDESDSNRDSIALRPLLSSIYAVLDSLEKKKQLPILRIYEYRDNEFFQIYSKLYSGPYSINDKSSIIKFKHDISNDTKELFFIFDFPDSSLFCTSDLFAHKIFYSKKNNEIIGSGHLEEFLEKFFN